MKNKILNLTHLKPIVDTSITNDSYIDMDKLQVHNISKNPADWTGSFIFGLTDLTAYYLKINNWAYNLMYRHLESAIVHKNITGLKRSLLHLYFAEYMSQIHYDRSYYMDILQDKTTFILGDMGMNIYLYASVKTGLSVKKYSIHHDIKRDFEEIEENFKINKKTVADIRKILPKINKEVSKMVEKFKLVNNI